MRTKLWNQLPLVPIKRPARKQAVGSKRRRTTSPGSRTGGREAKRNRTGEKEQNAYVVKYRKMLSKKK